MPTTIKINANATSIIFKYVAIGANPANNIKVITTAIKAHPIKISPIKFFLFRIRSFQIHLRVFALLLIHKIHL